MAASITVNARRLVAGAHAKVVRPDDRQVRGMQRVRIVNATTDAGLRVFTESRAQRRRRFRLAAGSHQGVTGSLSPLPPLASILTSVQRSSAAPSP